MNIVVKEITGYHEDKFGLLTLVITDGNGNTVSILVSRAHLEEEMTAAKVCAEVKAKLNTRQP